MKSIIKLNRYTLVIAGVWIVAAIVLGGGYILFHGPQKNELAQIKNQYNESLSDLERAQLAAQDQTKTQLKQQCEEVGRLISGFSTHQDTVTELVFEIGRIATDLRLSEFSSKNQTQKDSTIGKSELLSEFWLEVEFQATFEQLAQFIYQLECHSPVVFVEELHLQRGQDTRKHKASLQLSFLAKTEATNKTVATATR